MEIDFSTRRKSSKVPEMGKEYYIVVCPKCKKKGAKNYPTFTLSGSVKRVVHKIEMFNNFRVVTEACAGE